MGDGKQRGAVYVPVGCAVVTLTLRDDRGFVYSARDMVVPLRNAQRVLSAILTPSRSAGGGGSSAEELIAALFATK